MGFLNSNTVIADNALLKRYRGFHLLVLKGLIDMQIYGPHQTRREITRCVIQHHGENKYSFNLVDLLVSCKMINMAQYDIGLVKLMEDGLNSMAVEFAMKLVQCYCINRGIKSLVTVIDLSSTIKALTLITANPVQKPEGLKTLIENLHQTDGKFGVLDDMYGEPTEYMQCSISRALRTDDPPWMPVKAKFLLSDWVNMIQWLTADEESCIAFATFKRQADQLGILEKDDLVTRFFRLCTETCVDIDNNMLDQENLRPIDNETKCYFTCDAYAHLLALLVKYVGGVTNTVIKINLLNKVLGIVAGVVLRDNQDNQTAFHNMLYHRIIIRLFIDLNAAEPIFENINVQVLTAFCNMLHILNPMNTPAFANTWLSLISHSFFMDAILYSSEQMYAQLLTELFKFLSPFLRDADLENEIDMLHNDTLQLLEVLLHDFPEFLCMHNYEFCGTMMAHCTKMRNLILRASPSNIPMPSPLTPNLIIDKLPEIAHPPCISNSFANMIQAAPFKKNLDVYLRNGSPATFPSMLVRNLKLNESNSPLNYNVPLINALVLYVGTEAINYINSKGLTLSMSTIANPKHTDFFYNLIDGLDITGRYLFFTAILNQLTYPNSHTHYFSCLLQYLFNEVKKEEIRKQFCMTVLERLINNHHYPWGLLITVIGLLKQPIFELCSRDYIQCFPDIVILFETVARLH
ncbi:hypothetical protein CHS0354_022536 [Potamilus streckersoni]|uniref:CCR4-NOT transcription complex subunit 1 n=1 Tax=Potamilus streckersoni TaxID=2493646 RepID=A0AAE0VUB1_9BIVA|nr:hypothetical protein CHS0354_022536 [Potamilus streckersoni]